MPNGTNTFKFKGQTYGLETIFSRSEAANLTYKAFGQEKNLLTKLLKLGFMVYGSVVYHPSCWTPLDLDPDTFKACKYTTQMGNIRFGKIESVEKRR